MSEQNTQPAFHPQDQPIEPHGEQLLQLQQSSAQQRQHMQQYYQDDQIDRAQYQAKQHQEKQKQQYQEEHKTPHRSNVSQQPQQQYQEDHRTPQRSNVSQQQYQEEQQRALQRQQYEEQQRALQRQQYQEEQQRTLQRQHYEDQQRAIQRPPTQPHYQDEQRQTQRPPVQPQLQLPPIPQQYEEQQTQRAPQYQEDRMQRIPQNMYKPIKTFESQLVEAHLLKLKSKQMDTFLGFFLKKKTIDKYTSNFEKYNTTSPDFLSDWQKCGKEKNIIILKLFLNINESNEWNMTLYDFVETYTTENRNMEKILHKCYNFCDVAWQSKKLDKLIEIMEE
jgi:hypothetical protein